MTGNFPTPKNTPRKTNMSPANQWLKDVVGTRHADGRVPNCQFLGWGGGDVNVPCTCRHVGCYARCWVGVGGMLTFLALADMLDATQDAGLGWGGC